MSPLTIKPQFISLILTLTISGCAELNPGPTDIPIQTQPHSNTQSSFDKLLDFGANMSAMPPTSQSELCQSLLSTQALLYSDDIQLQLMIGRLLSSDCGNIPKILKGIETINPTYSADDRLRKLIAIHTQALSRIHNQAKTTATAKQKSKKAKPPTEVAKEALPEPNPNENHLLREKLEAIRSIEKQMDESLEGN